MSVNKMFEELCTELYARYLYFECPLCALYHMDDGAKGDSIVIYKPKKSVLRRKYLFIDNRISIWIHDSLSFLKNSLFIPI